MSALWTYFWPCVRGRALVGGLIAGTVAFRAQRRGGTWRWRIGARRRDCAARSCGMGPLGAADRFAPQVERDARNALDLL